VALAPNDLLARIKPLRVTLASGRCSTPKRVLKERGMPREPNATSVVSLG